VAVVKKVVAIGNSAGVIVYQAILKQVDWKVGTEVNVRVAGHRIVLSPHIARYATDEEADAAFKYVVRTRRNLLKRLAKR